MLRSQTSQAVRVTGKVYYTGSFENILIATMLQSKGKMSSVAHALRAADDRFVLYAEIPRRSHFPSRRIGDQNARVKMSVPVAKFSVSSPFSKATGTVVGVPVLPKPEGPPPTVVLSCTASRPGR